MQAKYCAVARSANQPGGDERRTERPIAAENGPHHSEQRVPLLRGAQAEPPNPIWSAEENRCYPRGIFDYLLSRADFTLDKIGPPQPQGRMRIGVIADLVAGFDNPTRDFRQTSHVHAALKKRCFDSVAIEQIEQGRSGGTGAVVKGQRDGTA